MFDGLQTLLIGSTFQERKQMNEQRERMIKEAEKNENLQRKLKENFVHLELSKMAAADPEFSYYCVYWSVHRFFHHTADVTWTTKEQEKRKIYGEDKWEQMLDDEAKKLWGFKHGYKAKKKWEIEKARKEYRDKQIEDIKKELMTPKTENAEFKKAIQEWEEDFAEWKIIKYNSELNDLSNILNVSPPLKLLDMTVLPLEAKKVIYGILHFGFVRLWASKKKIIAYEFYIDDYRNREVYKTKSVAEEYAELTTYQTLHDFAPTSDSPKSEENLENKISNLELKISKQTELLEKIEENLERLLSLGTK